MDEPKPPLVEVFVSATPDILGLNFSPESERKFSFVVPRE
ncbi:hypothetical protein F652_274 [Enterobacteriaceae bacterium bta3-1]|nr:hypothetical protein F652_274 [Enterobacteriaceae bacterium bta3-1]